MEGCERRDIPTTNPSSLIFRIQANPYGFTLLWLRAIFVFIKYTIEMGGGYLNSSSIETISVCLNQRKKKVI